MMLLLAAICVISAILLAVFTGMTIYYIDRYTKYEDRD